MTTYELPYGQASIMDEEPVEGSGHYMFGRYIKPDHPDDVRSRREKLHETFARIAAGRRKFSDTKPRFRCGTDAVSEYRRVMGREPRTIEDYLRSIGVTDAARLHEAHCQWTGAKG